MFTPYLFYQKHTVIQDKTAFNFNTFGKEWSIVSVTCEGTNTFSHIRVLPTLEKTGGSKHV